MPVFGEDLAAEVGRRYGAPVEMMQLNHGIFDEASISVIAFDTVREICRLAGQSPDVTISPECCRSFTAIGSLPGGRVVGRCALIRQRGRRPRLSGFVAIPRRRSTASPTRRNTPMPKDLTGDTKPDPKPEIVTGTVELFVTPELREKIALKRLKRQKARAKEIGVIDLGDNACSRPYSTKEPRDYWAERGYSRYDGI